MLLCELFTLKFTPLLEAKSVRDFRHDDISDQFKYWGTKAIGYINPADGFNFLYNKGELLHYFLQIMKLTQVLLLKIFGRKSKNWKRQANLLSH